MILAGIALGFSHALGAAGAAIGEPCLYERLFAIVSLTVDYDLKALVRYKRFSTPDFIFPETTDVMHARQDFDPFDRYWQEHATPAVKSLRQLAGARTWPGFCARESQDPAKPRDEVAMFLPPLGSACLTLLFGRQNGTFSIDELSQLQMLLPLIAGLHEAHVKTVLRSGGVRETAGPPYRLVDRSGAELSANTVWRTLAGDAASGLVEAVAALPPRSRQINLPRGRILVRQILPADFAAAPAAFVDVVHEPSWELCASRSESWLAPLTHREREIVMLTLQGYPIAGIAKRLGLGRGTVKNHRLRVYQKLDITTERELFLAHLRNLRATGQNETFGPTSS